MLRTTIFRYVIAFLVITVLIINFLIIHRGYVEKTETAALLKQIRPGDGNVDDIKADGQQRSLIEGDSIYSLIRERKFSSEILNNLKIYVYILPAQFNREQLEINRKNPPKMWDPNCTGNFYSAEYSFHQFLLGSPFQTQDPWEADFFYVPSYTSCFLINNQPNNLTKTANFNQKLFAHITQNYPYFNLSGGRDHIWIFSQGFGARMFGDWKLINNGIFLVHNGQFTLDEFTPHKDIAIPPDLSSYNFPAVYEMPHQKRPTRKWLGHFGGTVVSIDVKDERGSFYSKGVRQYIKKHFSKDKKFRITGTRIDSYIHDMMSSKFCLCPEGWHAWNPRPYQAVLLGCIPVLLTEELELAFEDAIDYSDFIIRVRPKDVSRLKTILQSVSDKEIKALQSGMEKIWRVFKYGKDGLAPYMILEALSRRKSPNHLGRSYNV